MILLLGLWLCGGFKRERFIETTKFSENAHIDFGWVVIGQYFYYLVEGAEYRQGNEGFINGSPEQFWNLLKTDFDGGCHSFDLSPEFESAVVEEVLGGVEVNKFFGFVLLGWPVGKVSDLGNIDGPFQVQVDFGPSLEVLPDLLGVFRGEGVVFLLD